MTSEPATIINSNTTDNEPRVQGEAQSGGPARVSEDAVKAAFETEDTPSTRLVEPTAPDDKVDQLAPKLNEAEDRQEALIDEGVEESFPASDPVSVKRIT